jgi:4-hydroxy-2-oxoheptanedioate aldolase
VPAEHFDLRQRLATGEPFLFSWMSVPSAALAAQVARLPLDGVCLDMQHGMIGFSDAAPMIASINAAGRPALVRALWNDPATPGQLFDAGACCVISPMVNNRAQAEALVRAAKYPPIGARSWGGYTALQASGLAPSEYLREANRMTMVFAMVETVEALDNVEEIAATPGLDGLFVGPSDLSITLSRGARIDKLGKDTLAAMKRVSSAAGSNGLVAGAFGGNAEVIRTYLGLGFTFLAAAVDVDLLQWGAASLRKSLDA